MRHDLIVPMLPRFVIAELDHSPTAHGGAAADAPLHAVLGGLSSLAVILDAAGTVTFANDAFLEATGWARGEVLGAEWAGDFVPDDCPTRALFAAALGGTSGRGEGTLLVGPGDRRTMAWDVVAVRDAAGWPAGTVCVGRDVTDDRRAERVRRELERALAALSDRDPLTGLPNQRGFVQGTEHAARVAARLRRADAVVVIRLVALAAVYAEHGEAAGDDAVCAAAEALRAGVRDSDVVARVMPDVFALYAVGTGTAGHAEGAARRVRAALEAQNARARAAGRAFDLLYTVGAAEREPGEDLDTLLRRARLAARRVRVRHQVSADPGWADRGWADPGWG